MPRAIVLINPRSRSGARAPVGGILSAFSNAGWQCEIWAGEGAEWTTSAAARARDQGVDAVFGAGGDGVLTQILPALLASDVALGVVPLGTGNVWARELGLPLHPERAITAQLAAGPARVDVGFANERPFLVIASVGWDAHIVRQVEADGGGKLLGQIAYPLAGVALAPGVRGVRSRVWLDQEAPIDVDLLWGVVTNGRLYAGLLPLLPQARLNDGLLDVALFAGNTALDATAHAARVLAGLHHANPRVLIRRVQRVRIETASEVMPVQTDGDSRGATPLDVRVAAGALLALGG
jgi:YegS/Rv2252/BmrU family lipid kinase